MQFAGAMKSLLLRYAKSEGDTLRADGQGPIMRTYKTSKGECEIEKEIEQERPVSVFDGDAFHHLCFHFFVPAAGGMDLRIV